jgi:hypothetical protein
MIEQDREVFEKEYRIFLATTKSKADEQAERTLWWAFQRGMVHCAAQQRAELDASQMRAELYKAAGELLAKETNELEDRLAYLDRLVEAVDVDDLERVIGGTPSGEARNYLAILNIIIADIKAKE